MDEKKKRRFESKNETKRRVKSKIQSLSKRFKKQKRDPTIPKYIHPALNHHLLAMILSYDFNPKRFSAYSHVCKAWKKSIASEINDCTLWWPECRRMLRAYEGHWNKTEKTDITFSRFIRENVIHRNPKLFSSGPENSWKQQYQNLLKQMTPRLVYVDCEDGQAFLPTAGWYTYIHPENRLGFYERESDENQDEKDWVFQMVDHVYNNMNDDDLEEFGYPPEEWNCGVTRMEHIARRFMEFYHRVKAKHNFCLHWTFLEDFECFPMEENPTTYQLKTPLEQVLSELSDRMNQKDDRFESKKLQPIIQTGIHDGSSGWLCSQRCGAYICYSDSQEMDHHTVFHSNDVKTNSIHNLVKTVRHVFDDSFELEKLMKQRAGYNTDEFARVSRYNCSGPLNGPVNYKGRHFQLWCVGVCGMSPQKVSSYLCQTFHFSPCEFKCSTRKESYFKTNEQKGCGKYLGPGVEHCNWKFSCGHTGSIFTDIEYCFDCSKRIQLLSKNWKCSQCTQKHSLLQKMDLDS